MSQIRCILPVASSFHLEFGYFALPWTFLWTVVSVSLPGLLWLVRNGLQQQLGVKLPSSLMFDYPTMKAKHGAVRIETNLYAAFNVINKGSFNPSVHTSQLFADAIQKVLTLGLENHHQRSCSFVSLAKTILGSRGHMKWTKGRFGLRLAKRWSPTLQEVSNRIVELSLLDGSWPKMTQTCM